MYDDIWSSFDSGNVNAGLPSFLRTPPELFDEMIATLERENTDVGVPTTVPPLPDISSHTCRVASTPSQSTYSMPGLTEDISTGNTVYSSMSASTPNYPLPFNSAHRDIVLGNNVDDPAISESSMFRLSFQHGHVVHAQPDDGLDRQLVGISPQCLSLGLSAIESSPPEIPIDPPAPTASTGRVFTGPIRTKRNKEPKKEPTCNRCDQCGRVSDRKSNLKEHMKTHDPNRERPFVCPESDCRYPFTRSNDLKRHLENTNIHGIRAE